MLTRTCFFGKKLFWELKSEWAWQSSYVNTNNHESGVKRKALNIHIFEHSFHLQTGGFRLWTTSTRYHFLTQYEYQRPSLHPLPSQSNQNARCSVSPTPWCQMMRHRSDLSAWKCYPSWRSCPFISPLETSHEMMDGDSHRCVIKHYNITTNAEKQRINFGRFLSPFLGPGLLTSTRMTAATVDKRLQRNIISLSCSIL